MNMDNDFVNKYINLVRKIAHSFNNSSLDFDDLVQEGLLGLYEAHKNFDQNRGATFVTFASHCIKNQILAYIKQEQRHSAKSVSDFQTIEQLSDQQNNESLDLPEDMPDIERKILNLYFTEKKTLAQIAERLNISREKARQLKNKAMRRYKILLR